MQPAAELFDPMTIDRGDRYAVFGNFRARGPVHAGTGPFPGMPTAHYLFSRAAVEEALVHRDLLQAPDGPYNEVRSGLSRDPVFEWLTGTMLLSDPPRHGLLRRSIAGLFTAAGLAELETKIAARARLHAGRCFTLDHFDLIQDFAVPYVVSVLSCLLGFNIADGSWVKSRTALIADALDFRGDSPLDGANSACIELRDFVASCLDTPCAPGSLAGAMLALEKDGTLTREDILDSCVLFLFAGQETVIDAIGNSALALARFPAAREELRSRPDMYVDAVDELLRIDSPAQFTVARVAAKDLVIAGTEIAAGQAVIGVLGSANHDPLWCEQPSRLDFKRGGNSRKVTFGTGIHVCVGQHLARMELKNFLKVFYAAACPAWQVASDQVRRRHNIAFRGVTRAPVMVGKPAGRA